MYAISPENATYKLSGITQATNAREKAQVTLSGIENFTGDIISPAITITPAEVTLDKFATFDGYHIAYGKDYSEPFWILNANTTVSSNHNLIVPFGVTLVILGSKSYTITNNGIISNNGTILIYTENNDGIFIVNNGSITGNQPITLGYPPTPPTAPVKLIKSVNWQQLYDTINTDLITNTSYTFNSKPHTITLKSISPDTAAYKISGNTSVINVGEKAQLTITGDGDFEGNIIISPAITITPQSITSVSWRYTNNNELYDLITNIDGNYNGFTYQILVKNIYPTNATYNLLETSREYVSSNPLQATLRGTGNYSGTFTSPSITITPQPITYIQWGYIDSYYSNVVMDLVGNKVIRASSSGDRKFTIVVKAMFPTYSSTYTLSGITQVNTAGQTAKVTFTGNTNISGTFTSPSIYLTGHIVG
jgi:hypothetical protein